MQWYIIYRPDIGLRKQQAMENLPFNNKHILVNSISSESDG